MKAPGALSPWNWSSSCGSRVQTVSRACLQRTGAPTQPGWQQVCVPLFCHRCAQWVSVLTAAYPPPSTARSLHEVSLHESIRYAPGDTVEKWLNELLCLDCLNIPRLISGCPLPQTCDLYPLLSQEPLLHVWCRCCTCVWESAEINIPVSRFLTVINQ